MGMGAKSQQQITEAIQGRQAFSINMMSGGPQARPMEIGDITRTTRLGEMPPEWSAELIDGLLDGSITYVVFSYGTPIGWIRRGGTPVCPRVTYSVTTSAHQGIFRRATS